MSDHPEHGGLPPGHSPEPEHAPPIGRAAMVLIVFIVTTSALLGLIHSKTPSTSSIAATSPSLPVTTTQPVAHPTVVTASTTTTAPAPVPVLVANGSNVPGEAGIISAQLQAGGWDVLPPVNASSNVTTSVIYFTAGHQASAVTIAKSLNLPTSAVQPLTSSAPVAIVGTAEVVVLVGLDVTSKSSTSTTTTTTVATSKTTIKPKAASH